MSKTMKHQATESKKRKDLIAVITIILMCITSLAGILSINYNYAHDFVNQYGQQVSLYGYGIYANDTYFKAPISIGTDFTILFVLVPMFLYVYIKYRNRNDKQSQLKLISVYAITFYYAASIAFGLTYNRLFLIYICLYTCSLFGMFYHISKLHWEKCMKVTRGMKIFLVLSGIALIVAWLPDIIPTVIQEGPLSLIGVYTTEITYVLDMGIISPLCFVCLYLISKCRPIGTLLFAILMRACIIVGIMMIPQMICQIISGVDLPLPVMITKSFSFVLLGAFAFYYNHKMYRDLNLQMQEA